MKTTKIFFTTVLLIAMFFTTGVFADNAFAATSFDMDADIARLKGEMEKEKLPPAPKVRLAVQLFENRSGKPDVPAEAITEMMTTELVSQDMFIVVEREKIGMSMMEQDLVDAGYGDVDTAPEYGKLAGAEFSMTGAVTQWETDTSGLVIPVGGIGLGLGSHTATVTLDVRVVNNRTGQVIWTAKEIGSGNQTMGGLATRYGGGFTGKTGGIYAAATYKAVTKVLTKLHDDGLKKMEERARENLENKAKRNTAHLIDADTKFTKATIDTGLNNNVRKGALFAVYRTGKVIKDLSGNVLGEEKSYIGILQVINAQAAFSNCKVIKGKGFKRGDKIEKINNINKVVLN